MTRNTSVVLTPHFEKLIAGMIAEGEYSSASEVVREGLRLLEARRTEIEVLREALREGEESGDAEGFSITDFVEKRRRERNMKAA
jgi:antitoxin ParD1/3/4